VAQLQRIERESVGIFDPMFVDRGENVPGMNTLLAILKLE
jgi:hypothetical protein